MCMHSKCLALQNYIIVLLKCNWVCILTNGSMYMEIAYMKDMHERFCSYDSQLYVVTFSQK